MANRAGSEKFDELYRESRDRLAVQIAALTGNRTEANDVVQEAFMKAWLKWGTVASYDDPEAWVRRVAHNLAVSRWRRTRRMVFQGSAAEAIANEPSEPVGIIAALQLLPVPQRRAIVLHHVVGLAVAEVAKEMGTAEGTVKSWLSRGRTRLAAELDAADRDVASSPPIKGDPHELAGKDQSDG